MEFEFLAPSGQLISGEMDAPEILIDTYIFPSVSSPFALTLFMQIST